MKKRILSILLTFCMVLCIVPVAVRAEEGDAEITEVNFKGLSGELWSYKDMTFATVDDDASYTIKEQVWNASDETSIKPDSASLKPKAGTDYTFTITLEAKDGYVFPIKSESAVFYDGTVRLDGTAYDGGVATVSKDGKTLTAMMFPLTTAKGITLQETSVGTENELTAALQDDTVGRIMLTDDITLTTRRLSIIIRDGRQLILDLNGHVLDLGENTISVGGNTVGIMTIMDSAPDVPHKFTPNTDGLWVWDKGTGTGTETVLGGVITSSEGSSGSAIHAASDGKVVMDGGNIVGYRTSDGGGAVCITAGGQFTMNTGSIVGCTAAENGGAVRVVVGTFELTGGVIKSCKAGNGGGGVYMGNENGTFTMTDGSITDCTATIGSGVYLRGGKMNANGGTVSGTVVLDVKKNGSKGIIQGSGSTVTQFNGAVTNYGEIKHGTFSGTVTLGDSNQVGTISGGIFNGPVTTDSEGEAAIGGGVFNKTVTIYRGEITNGIFNKDVVVYNAQASFRCTTLTGGTYNGLIINKSEYAAFAGAHSPLGIVETKPSSMYSNDRYRTVTFDLAGGKMDYPVRYFLDDGKISDQIKPNERAGYFFAGWYNGENKWNHGDTVGEDDLTLTAHWTACDHSGHTGEKPTCTTSVICTACGGTIAALGHNFSVEQHNENEHWKKCSRCDAIDGKEPHDWNSGTVTKPASCVVSGEKTYTCIDCSFEKIKTIDAKRHSYGEEWQHDATHHWHDCNNCAEKLDRGEHTGSTATCTKKAKCEVCGENYGSLDANNHTGIAEWVKDAQGHAKKWSCCGAVIVASEAHEWSDSICRECGYGCLHTDADKNHICEICGNTISNHEDADKNHVCDYCEKIISNHEDADKDHVCDYCEKIISNHEDADKNHVCDYCEKIISNHEDADKNHVCDYCGKTISNHEDVDKNHVCDYCGKTISNHEDADRNHVCDYCGKVITNHAGGKATCKDKAVCEVCGKAYGELDANNHSDLKHVDEKVATKDAEGNIEYWYCEGCDKYYSDADAAKEITKAATVTARLPDDPKPPQTGDNSNLMLWIALLFISSGVCTALTIKRKYRHGGNEK